MDKAKKTPARDADNVFAGPLNNLATNASPKRIQAIEINSGVAEFPWKTDRFENKNIEKIIIRNNSIFLTECLTISCENKYAATPKINWDP